MIFYRYQNTKTMEKSSQYVDMKALYNEAIYRRDYSSTDKVTVDFLVENLYDEFSQELVYRKNLAKFQYKHIIKKVCEIAISSEKKECSLEEKRIQRIEAYKKIDKLMENYPLDGIFVIPEYSSEFEFGTKYSIPELRTKVISKLNVSHVKYLAIYKGEVINREMIYGGTLISPTKILAVLPLFDGANDINYLNIESIYRHIEDKNKLIETISFQKDFLVDCIKYSKNSSIPKKIASSHVRELIILQALNMTGANYKDLQYRFVDDKHLIEINKDNTTYKYCIYKEDVTINNLLNNDLVKHEGFCIIDDFFNNIKKRELLSIDIAV